MRKSRTYFERLHDANNARDLLALSHVIHPSDVMCLVANVKPPNGTRRITFVVSGNCIEQYRAERLILNEQFLSLWEEVVVYFVNTERRTYRKATPEFVKSNLGDLLPARREVDSNPCYRVDLSGLEEIDIPL